MLLELPTLEKLGAESGPRTSKIQQATMMWSFHSHSTDGATFISLAL